VLENQVIIQLLVGLNTKSWMIIGGFHADQSYQQKSP